MNPFKFTPSSNIAFFICTQVKKEALGDLQDSEGKISTEHILIKTIAKFTYNKLGYVVENFDLDMIESYINVIGNKILEDYPALKEVVDLSPDKAKEFFLDYEEKHFTNHFTVYL